MPPCVYHVDPPELLRTIALDDDLTLIFHTMSGMTHVVASPVPEMLALLGERADTADGLLARLGDAFDLSGEADARAALVARLDELEQTGLVRAQ